MYFTNISAIVTNSAFLCISEMTSVIIIVLFAAIIVFLSLFILLIFMSARFRTFLFDGKKETKNAKKTKKQKSAVTNSKRKTKSASVKPTENDDPKPKPRTPSARYRDPVPTVPLNGPVIQTTEQAQAMRKPVRRSKAAENAAAKDEAAAADGLFDNIPTVYIPAITDGVQKPRSRTSTAAKVNTAEKANIQPTGQAVAENRQAARSRAEVKSTVKQAEKKTASEPTAKQSPVKPTAPKQSAVRQSTAKQTATDKTTKATKAEASGRKRNT